jgi:hypothetical protein
MSSSDSTATTETFPVRITANENDVITIFDGRGNTVAREVHVCQTVLPRGLYTVRTQFAAATNEQVIRVVGPINLQAKAPEPFSAIPHFFSSSAHEYYSYTSAEWSIKDTRAAIGPPPHDARLMLYVRAVDADQYKGGPLLQGLSLRDEYGDPIAQIDGSATHADMNAGYAAFSVAARAGAYRLRYDGSEPREAVLTLFQHWATNAFILFRDTPRLATMSMALSHMGLPFDPTARVAQTIDLGLWSLQNGVTAFPREAMHFLLDGKFENPLSGLLGAHLLLLRPDTRYEQTVVPLTNLRNLLGDSSDVRALELIASRRWPEQRPPDARPILTAPMLRASAEALIEAAAAYPQVLPETSLVARAAPYRYTDSPWFMWDPVRVKDQSEESFESMPTRSLDFGRTGDLTASALPRQPKLDWVDYGLLDLLARNARRKRSGPFTITSIARSMDLPASTVRTRLERLHQFAATGMTSQKSDDEAWTPEAVSVLIARSWET